ncbi:hypothetical protein [Sphingorhabdus sp. 109]|uniref:hypothetical protein n=1 Tax=Sphingorhabdus sp. 109 TaxID=2653173 RepID=UPI0012F307FE|nr:hypothetical protein [Sphingorhabdus sp. 109]VWX62588.1 hypothetical protein SPHINGOR109_90036 [Sphingorhabdus sp. 109]
MNWSTIVLTIVIILMLCTSAYSYRELRAAERQNWREEIYFWAVILFPWGFFIWAILDLAWDSARRWFRRRILPILRRWFYRIRRAGK